MDIQVISVETVAIPGGELNTIVIGNDGSGILIDDEGTILTASHVIQTSEKVTVTLLGGEQVPATVAASANWGDIFSLWRNLSRRRQLLSVIANCI